MAITLDDIWALPFLHTPSGDDVRGWEVLQGGDITGGATRIGFIEVDGERFVPSDVDEHPLPVVAGFDDAMRVIAELVAA